ncbi:MAG: hypothetical protein Q8N53_15515 [Longimicrobiales bacterium]|nr:hypothetical protein [Longimicrobiales bacterium]
MKRGCLQAGGLAGTFLTPLGLLLLLSAALSAALSAQDRAAARREYESGQQAAQSGQIDEAIAAYRRAVAADPSEWRYSYTLGEVLQDRAKRWSEAIEAFEDAWEKGYRRGITRHRIAECRYFLEDEDAALADFERAISFHQGLLDSVRGAPPELLRLQLADSHLWAARIRADRREYETAYRSALAAMELDARKDHRGRVLSLGHVAFGWADYDEARRFYELSLRDLATGAPLADLAWDDYPDWHIPSGVLLEVAENRARLGRIEPEYTHSVLALVIRDQDVEIERDGRRVRVHEVINQRQRREAEARLRWLKQVVESLSDGKLSLSFVVADDTTRYRYEEPTRPAWIGDRSVIGPLIDDFDTMIRLWPYGEGRGSAWSGTVDLRPYADAAPLRGGVHLHPEHSYGMWIHEFFHVFEAMAGISPTHGYYDEQRGRFPGWTGPKNAQLDYFRWHFRTTLPRVGWANLNFHVKHPVGAAKGPVPAPADPQRVSVLPVFFVPAGARAPSEEEQALLLSHLAVAQRRYTELLAGRDSFLIDPHVLVHRSTRPLAFFREAYDQGAPELVAELLEAQGVGRYDARHVYIVVVMNDADDFPPGAGRPLNGGLGTGVGVATLSSFGLNRVPNFQSTLQHELGHAFGLVHADAYGEDMATSPSLMSYNLAHHTAGLRPNPTPGTLLPVELASLALNRRIFPGLADGQTVTLPPPRPGVTDLAWLPPMALPGYPPAAPSVTTSSGGEYDSRASRIVVGRVRPDAGPGVTFDAGNMWHSPAAPDGWVVLDIAFPKDITLTGVGLHTGHSGLYHHAEEVRVEVEDEVEWREVVRSPVRSAGCLVDVPATIGRAWRVRLRAGASGMVVVRGLEFRGAWGEDIYPPMVREAPPAREPCDDG